MLRKMFFGLLIIGTMCVAAAIAQEEPTAQPTDWLNVRTGPGTQYAVLESIAPGTEVVLEARDETSGWVLMHTTAGTLRGWISTCCITPSVSIDTLPVSYEHGDAQNAPPAAEEAPPAAEGGEAPPPAEGGGETPPVVTNEGRPLPPNLAAGNTARVTTYLNMRAEPNAQAEVITLLAPDTELIFDGGPTADGLWVPAHTMDGYKGWVSTCCLIVTGVTNVQAPVDTSLPSAEDIEAAQAPESDVAMSAVTTTAVKWRAEPSEESEVVKILPRGTELVIIDPPPNSVWVRGFTVEGEVPGWVSTCCISYTGGAALGEAKTVTHPLYAPDNPREAELLDKLTAIPILPDVLSTRAAEIFATGQSYGNRADVFTKVGDCMTTFHAFLLPFGTGEYDLGPYAYMQPTIEFFLRTPPRSGVTNSFVNQGLASEGGFNTRSVLDPVFAPPGHCEPGESPLVCSYQNSKPAVSIILLGAVDVYALTPEEYREDMRQIVQTSIDKGVIPVLNTIPADRNYFWMPLLELSSVVVDVAHEYNVPLINLWLATQNMANGGINTEDYLHLSFDGDRFISFDGDEQQWGYDMRNLVTLQMLDEMRRNVLQR